MSLLEVSIAAVAIILITGLLWPLLPQYTPEDDGKLQRLAKRIWHFQCEQAGKHLSEHEAKMLGRELSHDLPLTSPLPSRSVRCQPSSLWLRSSLFS